MGARQLTSRRSLVRRVARSMVLLLGLPVLTLGFAVGTAAASGSGKVTRTPRDAPNRILGTHTFACDALGFHP